jgi:hypothetical protein
MTPPEPGLSHSDKLARACHSCTLVYTIATRPKTRVFKSLGHALLQSCAFSSQRPRLKRPRVSLSSGVLDCLAIVGNTPFTSTTL